MDFILLFRSLRSARILVPPVLAALLAFIPSVILAEDFQSAVLPEHVQTAPNRPGARTEPEQGLLFFPSAPLAGKDRWAAGGVWQITPMLTAAYRLGIGSGFSIDARLRTIFIYRELGGGASWGTKWGPISWGLGLHFDGFFGTLGKALIATTQFDTVGWGLLTKPSITAGIRVAHDSWLSLTWEFYISPYQAEKLGDLVLSPHERLYEGSGLSVVVEYAPKKQGVLYYGASLYNTMANYPMLFFAEASPTSEAITARMLWYIGLLGGYEF